MNDVRTKKTVVTLDDVAKMAGVSKCTASFVVNRTKSNTKVSVATRTRVLEAAKELRYYPNAIGRSLTRRRTDIIGFYCGFRFVNSRSLFFTELISGFQEGCYLCGKDLLIHSILAKKTPEEVCGTLESGQVDGLVLYGPPDDPVATLMRDSRLPIVAVADAIPGVPSVVVDDVLGAKQLAEHLAAKGHRRVLHWDSGTHPISIQRRADSFLSTAKALGMEITHTTDYLSNDFLFTSDRLPGDTPEEKILRALGDNLPSAVVAFTDLRAFNFLVAAKKLGIDVPGRLAIVGFDGCPTDIPPLMPLTTVYAPWVDVAKTAITLVASQLQGNEVPDETMLPIRFVKGETT